MVKQQVTYLRLHELTNFKCGAGTRNQIPLTQCPFHTTHQYTPGKTYPIQGQHISGGTSFLRRRRWRAVCEGRGLPPAARRSWPWCSTGRRPWPAYSPPGQRETCESQDRWLWASLWWPASKKVTRYGRGQGPGQRVSLWSSWPSPEAFHFQKTRPTKSSREWKSTVQQAQSRCIAEAETAFKFWNCLPAIKLCQILLNSQLPHFSDESTEV